MATRPDKFSCHILFPQIKVRGQNYDSECFTLIRQFRDHAHQSAFVLPLLNCIHMLKPGDYAVSRGSRGGVAG